MPCASLQGVLISDFLKLAGLHILELSRAFYKIDRKFNQWELRTLLNFLCQLKKIMNMNEFQAYAFFYDPIFNTICNMNLFEDFCL